MKDKFTILVNSSDGFEDCWNPFFTLFSKNWGNCEYPIVLNTEHKTYNNPFKELNIKSSKSNSKDNSRRFTWRECIIKAIKQIDTPLVLYFQEDYFVERKIDVSLINEFANLMLRRKDIKYIGLTHFGNNPPFTNWNNDERLWVVNQKNKI